MSPSKLVSSGTRGRPSKDETEFAIKVVLEIETAHKLVHSYLISLDVPTKVDTFSLDWGHRWWSAYQGINRVSSVSLTSYQVLSQYRNRWNKHARNAVNAHADLLRFGPSLIHQRDRTRLQYNKTLFQAKYEMYQAKRNLWMAQYERNHQITLAALARRYMLIDTEDDLAL